MDASGTAAPASPMARPEDVIAAMVNNMNQMHTQGNQMVNNLNQLHAQNAQLAANLEAMSQTLQDVTIRPSTANPRIPFKLELPKFAGTSRENVANWIKQMDSKFNLANVPEDSRGLWAIESLTSLAAQVVANSGIEDLLKELLRQRFVPKNQSIYLREKLFAMKQGNGDLNAYLLKFQEVLTDLDPMPTEDDKLVYFINGLRERTREAVLYESPTTLDNATQIALAFEQAHFAHGTNNRANTAVPMDLDVIEVDTRTRERPEPPDDNGAHLRIANHFSQSRSFSNSRGSFQPRQGYGRGRGTFGRGNYRRGGARRNPFGNTFRNSSRFGSNSRSFSRSSSQNSRNNRVGPCYECYRYGHLARNCPNRQPNRPQPQRVSFRDGVRLNGQAARYGHP